MNTSAAQTTTEAIMKIELIQGTMEDFGGYSVDGNRFVSEEAEAMVDEAKEVAYSTGRQVEDVLAKMIEAA
jgi:hypothetical protein